MRGNQKSVDRAPELFKIGYSDPQQEKPRILVTGERLERFVLSALEMHTEQPVTYVAAEKLLKPSHGYNKDKDLLLIVIKKSPGGNPIRGFDGFDGPLYSYTNAFCSFEKKAALVLVNSCEMNKMVEIQRQAERQIPELKAKAIRAVGYDTRQIAHQAQALFQPQS